MTLALSWLVPVVLAVAPFLIGLYLTMTATLDSVMFGFWMMLVFATCWVGAIAVIVGHYL